MKNERARLLRRMERLAGCRVNDAVKLAFLDGEQLGEIDGLDLGALKEFKRSGNGPSISPTLSANALIPPSRSLRISVLVFTNPLTDF